MWASSCNVQVSQDSTKSWPSVLQFNRNLELNWMDIECINLFNGFVVLTTNHNSINTTTNEPRPNVARLVDVFPNRWPNGKAYSQSAVDGARRAWAVTFACRLDLKFQRFWSWKNGKKCKKSQIWNVEALWLCVVSLSLAAVDTNCQWQCSSGDLWCQVLHVFVDWDMFLSRYTKYRQKW